MNIVIVPVRVNLPMTIACVKSLQAQDITDGVTLYIIDNGTDDGCGPYLRSLDGICVSYTKPKGVSTIWNRALAHCFDQLHLPYVMVVNNDTVLRPDTYRLLVEDGGPFVTAVGVSRSDIFDEQVLVDPPRPHPDFSCYLIRREVWDRIGGFDETMVSWAGDNDYHIRMHQAGINAQCISVPFYHIASGTLKHVDPDTHELLCRQSDRDRDAFKQKWGCMPGSPEYNQLFEVR